MKKIAILIVSLFLFFSCSTWWDEENEIDDKWKVIDSSGVVEDDNKTDDKVDIESDIKEGDEEKKDDDKVGDVVEIDKDDDWEKKDYSDTEEEIIEEFDEELESLFYLLEEDEK